MQAGVEPYQRDRTSCPAPGREHRKNWHFQMLVPEKGQDSAGGVGTVLEDLLYGQDTAVAGHGDVTGLYPGAWKHQPSPGNAYSVGRTWLSALSCWRKAIFGSGKNTALPWQWPMQGSSNLEEPWGWSLAATRTIQRLYMHGCSQNKQEQLRRTDVLKIRAFPPN